MRMASDALGLDAGNCTESISELRIEDIHALIPNSPLAKGQF